MESQLVNQWFTRKIGFLMMRLIPYVVLTTLGLWKGLKRPSQQVPVNNLSHQQIYTCIYIGVRKHVYAREEKSVKVNGLLRFILTVIRFNM